VPRIPRFEVALFEVKAFLATSIFLQENLDFRQKLKQSDQFLLINQKVLGAPRLVNPTLAF